jgi:hypothetical protein
VVKATKKRYHASCHYRGRSLKRAKAKYKRIYEKRYFGQYVAIDLETSEAFVAPNAAAAIRSAQNTGKEGALFHLVRIGYQTGANSR